MVLEESLSVIYSSITNIAGSYVSIHASSPFMSLASIYDLSLIVLDKKFCSYLVKDTQKPNCSVSSLPQICSLINKDLLRKPLPELLHSHRQEPLVQTLGCALQRWIGLQVTVTPPSPLSLSPSISFRKPMLITNRKKTHLRRIRRHPSPTTPILHHLHRS